MNARQIPTDKVRMLGKARARLMRALDNGGADIMPQPAARAQAMFDCWMQEQEENFQPEDIARCRHAMLADLEQLEAKPVVMAAAPAPAREGANLSPV